MIAIILLVLRVITLGITNQEASAIVVIPAMPNYAPVIDASECMCDECYSEDCFTEALVEFDAIFNAVEFKRAKNGRSMVKGIHSSSFKFVKKG
ncbi:hypothetical protein [Chitinophaga sp.]|uniref:hypothetical protein n=1 Tax=Chitinophaga sp. TaxID=1869181 RepID=UPI002F9344AD